MLTFNPTHIHVDRSVARLPHTKKILRKFNHIKHQIVEDPTSFKIPLPATEAKKHLLLTRHRGTVVKACQGMGDDVCCHYLTISLGTNCHFDCTYCILQDYLKNNPIMTIYTNIDEILLALETFLQTKPKTVFRVGTGELADSLALDAITGYAVDLVQFAAGQKNLILELKTKSKCIANLLGLDHRGKTVVSWSLNPQSTIDLEEHKTASLDARLAAARQVANCGYPVGFHLDPLLALDDWKQEYAGLVERLAAEFKPREIAWISLGSLRYTPGLKAVTEERFPKSRIHLAELFPTADGKIRYFRKIREELYAHVKNLVERAFPKVPHYLCMETTKVWENTYAAVPSQQQLEHHLAERFAI